MDGNVSPDATTGELRRERSFPEPIAVISIRNATTFRDQDEEGQPILIITDGVTSVALDSGLSGLSFGVVSASQRLAEALDDFATSITARWRGRERPGAGRHRRNGGQFR